MRSTRHIASLIVLAAASLAVSPPAAAQGFGGGFRGSAIGGGPANIGRASPGIGRIGPAPGQFSTVPSGGRFPGARVGGGGPPNVGRPSRLPREPGVVVGRPGGSVVVPDDDVPVATKRPRKPRKDIAKSVAPRPSAAKGGGTAAAAGGAGAGGAGRLPAAGEQRFVPDEVLVETAAGVPEPLLDAIARRHRLVRLAAYDVELLGTRLHRWRIADRRSVPTVIAALANERVLSSVQTNNVFQLEQEPDAPATTDTKDADAAALPGDPAQYALAKLRVDEAHRLASGHDVLVAVI